MKPILYFCSAILFLTASCKKREQSSITVIPKEETIKTHSVEGIIPVTLRHGLDHATLSVNIINLTTKELSTKVSVGDIPQDVSFRLEKDESKLPYNGLINIDAFFAAPGTYNYNLMTKTGDEETITHTARLTINEMGQKECAGIFYNAVEAANGQDLGYKEVGTARLHYDNTGRIFMGSMVIEFLNHEEYYVYDCDVTAPEIIIDVNCNNRNITIPGVIITARLESPMPDVRQYKVSGSGMINPADGTFTINYKFERTDGTKTLNGKIAGKLNF